jgi:hypothetical protein
VSFEPIATTEDLREGCLRDDARAWHSLVAVYGPTARHLVCHYFREVEGDSLLQELFRAARAEAAPFWEGFTGRGQKEFLGYWRRHVMRSARSRRPGAPSPIPDHELQSALAPLPIAKRQIALLALRRYGPSEAAAISKSAPEGAEEVRRKLREDLGKSDRIDPLEQDHDGFFATLEDQRSDECLPDKYFAYLEDGWPSWRDRDQADRHLESCLPCQNRFANYREVHYYFRVLGPWGPEECDRVAEVLGLPKVSSGGARLSWWRRLGKRGR